MRWEVSGFRGYVRCDFYSFFAQKIEDILLDNKNIAEKVEAYENRLNEINDAVTNNVPQFDEKFSEKLEEMRNDVSELKEVQERVLKKLVEVEKIKKEDDVSEVKIKAAIPIRKEKALEPLTETELMVLETIGREGEKTAPEIRDKITLTREHTARLMKKLYKDGYLERDTHKMPYVYRLKEEMKKILKKREVSDY
ncbi:MAG: MarR family transcriptional regulator [Candidatus Bathyarchaeota archaeon]